MRDVNHIYNILDAIQELWEQNPDWRLGQLVHNSIKQATSNWDAGDELFNIDDDVLLQGINQLNLYKY